MKQLSLFSGVCWREGALLLAPSLQDIFRS